jgi:hypothetical protein
VLEGTADRYEEEGRKKGIKREGWRGRRENGKKMMGRKERY